MTDLEPIESTKNLGEDKEQLGPYCSDRPIYENYTILDPDDNFLCHCSEKKINWYLDRNLAVSVAGHRKTIKLNFQPKIVSTTNNPYYEQRLKNRCVICGERDDLFRTYIVPKKLRCHFPSNEISRNHHDILPFCGKCKDLYDVRRGQFEKELVIQYEIEVFLFSNNKNKKYKKYDQYAMAFKQKLDEYWWWTVTKMYRQQFLDSMEPKFLPNHWNIEFRKPQ